MSNKRQPLDKVFLALVLLELVFGIVALTSVSGPLSYDRYHSTWTYVWHQVKAGVVPGLLGMWLLSRVDHRRIARWAPFVMIGALLLMVLVFIPPFASGFGSARSWLKVGSLFSFQPVEILKLALIVYLAALAGAPDRTPKQIFLPAGLVFCAAAVLLALQPDFGSLLVLAAIFFIMVYSASVPFAYLFATLAIGGAVFYAFAKTASYRVARLMVFLHPELDPQGIGYQINQAFLAIGSGGLWGLGLGHSQQKYSYLPQVMNDSIYPVIAEELGFFFALGLVVLIAAIFFRGLKIARNASDPFGRLATIGVISWLAVQSFMNIGAMMGLMPLTGVPLPLISYGGTAMAMNLCSIGIVLSISRGKG